MAEQMYSNPGGMAPQIGWKPSGFLAGAMYGNQEENYNKAIQQQQILQNLGILMKQAEYQDYQASGPVRDAKRGLDISTYKAQAPIQGVLAGGDPRTSATLTRSLTPQPSRPNTSGPTQEFAQRPGEGLARPAGRDISMGQVSPKSVFGDVFP